MLQANIFSATVMKELFGCLNSSPTSSNIVFTDNIFINYSAKYSSDL